MARRRSTTQSPEGQIALFGAKETPDAFRKAVQILHSRPKQQLTLVQRKLGNAWAKHAYENEPDKDGWWQLPIMALARDIGFDSNNRQHLKDSAEALMGITFEWDVMAPPNTKKPWKASVMFPEVEIHSDVIRYQISSQLRALITNPEIYATIDMNVVRRFRRASSLAIWEFCVRYERIGQTAEAAWTDFRDNILGEEGEAKTYQEYKYFKAKVLKPAIAEINSESNHEVALVEAKVGKRVASIRFQVHRKQTPDDQVDDGQIEVVGEMVRLGVMQSEAKRLAKEHSVEAIKAALDYTKRRVADRQAAKLENPAAYFRHALQNRYASTTEAPSDAGGGSAKPARDLRQEYLQAQLGDAEKYFKELDASDQARLIERYNAQAMPALQLKPKRSSKAAEAAFRRWLAKDTWGEPTADDLVEFAQRVLSQKS